MRRHADGQLKQGADRKAIPGVVGRVIESGFLAWSISSGYYTRALSCSRRFSMEVQDAEEVLPVRLSIRPDRPSNQPSHFCAGADPLNNHSRRNRDSTCSALSGQFEI